MSPFVLLYLAVLVPLATNAEVELVHTCIPVNFENGLEKFDSTKQPCSLATGEWDVGHYTDIGINSPYELSTTFIRSSTLSCTSSFDFELSESGTVEVTFFMSTQTLSEFLNIIVNEIQENGVVAVANQILFNSITPDINVGWNTIRFNVERQGNFRGYVSNFKLLYSSLNSSFQLFIL